MIGLPIILLNRTVFDQKKAAQPGSFLDFIKRGLAFENQFDECPEARNRVLHAHLHIDRQQGDHRDQAKVINICCRHSNHSLRVFSSAVKP
jgi:hypothetical protein